MGVEAAGSRYDRTSALDEVQDGRVCGNPEQALALAEKAYVATRDKGALKVEALTLAFRGFYRLSLGDTAGGFADQDHAATLALSSNVDPITGGTLYCNILWASRMFGDWARAEQWTLGYQRFCTDTHMELSGSCQLHRSEVLGVRGWLEEALLQIQDAVTRIVDDAPWALGDAHRILGDVHAAIGNEAAAFEAYDKAYALGWCPEPGHAVLLLETGDAGGLCQPGAQPDRQDLVDAAAARHPSRSPCACRRPHRSP